MLCCCQDLVTVLWTMLSVRFTDWSRHHKN